MRVAREHSEKDACANRLVDHWSGRRDRIAIAVTDLVGEHRFRRRPARLLLNLVRALLNLVRGERPCPALLPDAKPEAQIRPDGAWMWLWDCTPFFRAFAHLQPHDRHEHCRFLAFRGRPLA
jgi:hypothetical protein